MGRNSKVQKLQLLVIIARTPHLIRAVVGEKAHVYKLVSSTILVFREKIII